ncbi:hypothetical protein [Bradyrhizobium erythrophlei]|uniref:Uncharacterized protein n=1 Tax=Bradyrhizobium erythrophlei TaxID=1437360 RepID=A0A1M5S167_9BRAD|nr:hypothetical protein [Bradyrhizobium erythrophlei]SHH32337.1 hypothetical protein SAMN05444169_6890 [Bradyrhizobium erythrophlei]
MQTFSANGIAERLERDRSTCIKALRNIPPDRMVKGKPQWKLSTASRAVEAHLRGYDTGGGNHQLAALIDTLETSYAKLDDQFARLEAQPDIEKRRELSLEMQIGATINVIEATFAETNRLDTESGCLMQIVTDKLCGMARSKLVDALDLWDCVDEVKAEIAADAAALGA